MSRHLSILAIVLFVPVSGNADDSKAALQPLNNLIGKWRGTGIPSSAAERQKGFWIETLDWGWQFKGDDAWLVVKIDKGKHYRSGELRYNTAKKHYELSLKTTDGKTHTFTGKLDKRNLIVTREADKTTERLVFKFLHTNRFVYSFETKPARRTIFARQYQVGVTRKGVAFAKGSGQPKSIVSGGLGTMEVSHNGKTYYVCCSGCRDEFLSDPDKYINEFEAKKKKQ